MSCWLLGVTVSYHPTVAWAAGLIRDQTSCPTPVTCDLRLKVVDRVSAWTAGPIRDYTPLHATYHHSPNGAHYVSPRAAPWVHHHTSPQPCKGGLYATNSIAASALPQSVN